MSSPAPSLSPCSSCGASTSLVCAVCLRFHLCSRPCAAKAWPGHRAACAEFSVLAALPDEAPAPVPPAAPMDSMEPAAGEDGPAFAGSGFSCAVCGLSNAAVCMRCRLVGYCGTKHQKKDWPTHKAVCRKGEFGMVPVQTWEQRMLAEAYATAPASLAATAALPPIADWNFDRDSAPSAEIMRAWRKAAAEGHSKAQCFLGYLFSLGIGVAKDVVAAAEWFAKAAAQGHADAQFNLGRHYQTGRGVVQDFQASTAWYAKAAAQGNVNAQCNLGAVYENGTVFSQDFKAAAAWYAKAASQGLAIAQYNLGRFYDTGRGVSQDFKEAAAWYAKAAAHGYAYAQFNLGTHYGKGLGVAQDFKAAAVWFAKAAAQGLADAQLSLGRFYETGRGVTQDIKAAAAWYGKAAAQGAVDAQFNLGACYEHGMGVAQNFGSAAEWYAKAAAQGDTEAAARRDACLAFAADAVARAAEALQLGGGDCQHAPQ